MLSTARYCLAILSLFSVGTVFASTLPQRPGPAEAQRIVKEETIKVTSPAACEFKFTVIEAKGDLTPTTQKFLRGMGYGVKGVPGGIGLPVKCGAESGSGWIDQAGELQAFILPVSGWFIERRGNEMKAVDGSLHVITKSLKLDSTDVEARYVRFVGAPPGEYSTRLLKDIGIGIKGVSSPVLMSLTDGRKLQGTLTADGVASVTAEPWKN